LFIIKNEMGLILKVMKNTVLGFIGLLLIYCGNLYSEETVAKADPAPEGSINIISTPGLLSLTNRLASEYASLNPAVKINVISSENINKDGFRETGANSGFTSGDNLSGPGIETFWKMTIGHEVIVPVINAKNQFLAELYLKGITAEKLASVFENPDKRVWSSFIPEGKNVPVHLYIMNDASVIAAVNKFLKFNQIPLDGIKFTDENEMIAALQNDPYAVGFCKMTSITGPDKKSMLENIKFLPIDKNGNGKIDYTEQIYNDPDALARGVWIGKYPKALYTDLYFVSSEQPANVSEIAFIKWMLTDGQQFLSFNGFNDLVYNERQSKLDKFNAVNITLPSKEAYSFPAWAVIILIALGIISILISSIAYYRRKNRFSVRTASTASAVVFTEHSVIIPKGLYFDRSHTWAFMEKNGLVRIGIDDFIQHVTGPVTRIEMKKPGDKVRKGDIILSMIQKGKQLNIYAPVSGTIKEQNSVLLSNSSVINSSPYSEGWVYMMEPANWSREIQFLDMAEKYRNWLSNEFSRLKDFLASSIKVDKLAYEHVVLQDGGALKDSILEDFGPEVWEDFQTNFLDTYK
jgi:glycine cleavage system H lipoate-binding protein/ABC-type phosphate transport system substrate-binding protein